jgi:hypothetical protein
MFLAGRSDGDRFGFSISPAGDVDNDGITDVIIGAPGGDYANLYYGSTLNSGPIVPDLSENDNEADTPIIEFSTPLKTTGNTPDITGADDGWEVWDGAYGFSGTPGSSTRYNERETIDPQKIAADGELIIGIGRSNGNSARPDSGAYGVEFSITNQMYNTINDGGNVVVTYNWLLDDTGLDAGDEAWIKTYVRNGTDELDLGWNIDSAGLNEVFYLNDPVDSNGFFVQDCADFFKKASSYYVDFGGRVENWRSSGGWGRENAYFHFDNFGLYITPSPDIKFLGTPDSEFGTSLGYIDKLNIDDYGDIIIGAPSYDSPNGANSGAIYGFFTSPSSPPTINSKNAEYVHYGETAGDNFGWALTGAVSIDNDEFGEIAVGAINYDFTVMDIGRIYMLSVTNVPRIRLLHR